MLSNTLLVLAAFVLTPTIYGLAVPKNAKSLPRAGGPAFVPIPLDCPVYDILPVKTSSASPNYAPSTTLDAFNSFSAYYPPPSTNETQLYIGCLEQCNGFEGCKAAYIAWDVPSPPLYGGPGGELMTACLFYNRTLVAGDFEVAAEGTHTGARTGNLSCK